MITEHAASTCQADTNPHQAGRCLHLPAWRGSSSGGFEIPAYLYSLGTRDSTLSSSAASAS